MTVEEQLFHSRNPIYTLPLEAFHDGSWRSIENAGIKSGSIIVRFEHRGLKVEEKVFSYNLRIQSRKAVKFDCCYFLRPGVDVCIYSSYPNASKRTQEKLQKAWHDAKIISVERKPHNSNCRCRFFVSFYRRQELLDMKKNAINIGMEEVSIENIAILQKLNSKPYGNRNFHWRPFKDCPSVHISNLWSGTFRSEVSWVIVISMLKGIDFDMKLMQNKIIYLVLNGDHGPNSENVVESDQKVTTVSFKRCNGVMQPNIDFFVSPVDAINMDLLQDRRESKREHEMFCNSIYLRRSERWKRIPDRFVTYASTTNMKSCPFKSTNRDQILLQDGAGIVIPENCLKRQNKDEKKIQNLKDDPNEESRKTVPFYSKRHINSGIADETRDQYRIAEKHEKVKHSSDRETLKNGPNKEKKNQKRHEDHDFSYVAYPKRYKNNANFCMSDDSTSKSTPNRTLIAMNDSLKIPKEPCANKNRKNSSKDGHRGGNPRLQSKKISKRKARKFLSPSSSILSSKKNDYSKTNTYRRKFSTATECKQMLKRFMEIIEFEKEKQERPVVAQWESIGTSNPRKDFSWPTFVDHQVECSEDNDLWKEMEDSLVSLCFTRENQDMSAEDSTKNNISNSGVQACQHKYILDEQIGIVCQLCSIVETEIRYILPSFLEKSQKIRSMEQSKEKERGSKCVSDLYANRFWDTISSREIQISEGYDTVWALIPEFRKKLHMHQKKAFEFLWGNIAGSLNPRNMDQLSKKTGGCVISHSPGTGKTLLLISFLISYLCLFPKTRPLILAPHVTLYTWYSEFKKWGVSIPVYTIHSRRNYKIKKQNCSKGEYLAESCRGLKPSLEKMHIMDCLEKLRKWHEHPSLLLMSYPCFFTLAQGDLELEYKRCIAQVLLGSPGILILDEGHNPRGTSSKLRKLLMEVKTSLRILLSGTLFQNNFKEYFNTLCLARPRFVYDLLVEFDRALPLNLKNRKRNGKSISNPSEKLARSVFIEEIAKRINSSIEADMRRGLEMLRKITNRFIDIYKGGVLKSLPGLHTYTLVINLTTLQREILEKLQQSIKHKGCPIELELLITAASIHPWLTKTIACFAKYLNGNDIDLDKFKFDIKQGSKVKFVIDLVKLCLMKREKVLIFCRSIPPIKLFAEIFEMFFLWRKGEEVLLLHGDQGLLQRESVINKFNNRETSRVLLASTTACAEGIDLTAASRLILLDSEWNPSKTKQAIARAFRLGQERVVYVYRLIASGTMEEEKYGRTVWKEYLSRMVFLGGSVEDSSCKQAENIEDDMLRKLVEDQTTTFQLITKHEEVVNNVPNDGEDAAF